MSVDRFYLLKYIGSKLRMVDVLCKLIPDHCTTYAELYCGSAALALNSRNFKVKILNDYDPHIANFWKVATNPATSQELLTRLQRTRYSWSDFQEAHERKEAHGAKQPDKVQWAIDAFLLNHQSFNATGENWIYRDRTSYEKRLTETTGIPLVFRRLQEQAFRVYNDNALVVMDKEDLLHNSHAFLFLDPPYLEGLRSDGNYTMRICLICVNTLYCCEKSVTHKLKSSYLDTSLAKMMEQTCTIITSCPTVGTAIFWVNILRAVK